MWRKKKYYSETSRILADNEYGVVADLRITRGRVIEALDDDTLLLQRHYPGVLEKVNENA